MNAIDSNMHITITKTNFRSFFVYSFELIMIRLNIVLKPHRAQQHGDIFYFAIFLRAYMHVDDEIKMNQTT